MKFYRWHLILAAVEALRDGDGETANALRQIMSPAEQIQALVLTLDANRDLEPAAAGPLMDFARTLGMED